MTTVALAPVGGACLTVGLFLMLLGSRRDHLSAPTARWRRAARSVANAARQPGQGRRGRRTRLIVWCGIGAVVWATTGWPVAGVAVSAVGLWGPWLLGSGGVVRERLDRLESVEGWCRRIADTLAGGGAVGLTQAIILSADHADDQIRVPVVRLAMRLRDQTCPTKKALHEFADQLDDRMTDSVAAALLLALHQQSSGVARVLRMLADGVARDVRARRDIEAARAESRQSIRMLLLIQAAVLAMLAVVPTFAAPYATAAGQAVMATLLVATVGLLVWMRRLALGTRAPRFLGVAASGRQR